jgi:hypothetical protein
VLSAAISGYLSPAPRRSLAIDQSVSPRCTVCLTVTSGVSAVGVHVAAVSIGVKCPVLEVRMVWLWALVGFGVETTVGAMAAGTGAAAATGAPCPDIGTAMNASIAVLTRVRAADCGSLSPGMCGTRIPRAREITSKRIDRVRNAHAAQETSLTKPRASVPSSWLDRADLIVSSEGMECGIGSAPTASRTNGSPTTIASRAPVASSPLSRVRSVVIAPLRRRPG